MLESELSLMFVRMPFSIVGKESSMLSAVLDLPRECDRTGTDGLFMLFGAEPFCLSGEMSTSELPRSNLS